MKDELLDRRTCWFCRRVPGAKNCAVGVGMHRIDGEGGPGAEGRAEPGELQTIEVTVPRCAACRAVHNHQSGRGCTLQLIGAGIGIVLGIAWGILDRSIPNGILAAVIIGALASLLLAGLGRLFVRTRGVKRIEHAAKHQNVKEKQAEGWLVGYTRRGRGRVWVGDARATELAEEEAEERAG
jgi:membrane protein implicated in regulation of membrane protease activity